MEDIYDIYFTRVTVTARIDSTPSSIEEAKEQEVTTMDGATLEGNPVETAELKVVDRVEFEPSPNPDPGPGERGKIADVSFFVGVKLEKLLYDGTTFRKNIGLSTFDDIKGQDKKVSQKILRKYNEAAALDFVSSVYITLKAVDATKIYAPWKETHRTHLVFNAKIDTDKITRIIYDTTFRIGTDKIEYKVVRNSIKPRRSRKSAQTF
jgi:hypothetical protein